MKKLLTMIGAAAVAVSVAAETLSVTKDMTLTKDVKCDSVSISENATLNLAGYSLDAGGISGGGTIVSANIVSAAFSKDYELLAYVKTPANNTDTYLDTGYKPGLSSTPGRATDRMETKVQFDGSLSSKPNYGIWSMQTEYIPTVDENRRSTTTLLNEGKFRYDYHNKTDQFSDNTVEQGKEYALSADYSTGYFYVDGERQVNKIVVNQGTWTVFTNVFLFCVIDLNRTSYSYKTNMFACDMRMYYFRAYGANGNLKIDLVPARRKADNTVGFYDRVGEKFIAPLSGSLIAGDVVTPAVDLTVPGGTCRVSVSGEQSTKAANLFNDNFTYKTGSSSRYFHNVEQGLFPLRIDYDFGEGYAHAVNMYRIWGGGNGDGTRSPSEWELWGSNSAYGSADETAGWTRLDSAKKGGNLDGVAAGTTANSCLRLFANETPYRYYRLKITGGGNGKYFDMTQIEYSRADATATPGELRVTVANGTAVTNSTLTLGGDLKFVKAGAGTFMSSVSNQLYMGGTDVKAGEFVVGAPLATAMTVSSGARLGFNFTSRDAKPVLTLGNGTSIPSTLGVSLYCDGEFKLPGSGVVLTSGYDFSGTTIDFTRTSWASHLAVGDGNNLWGYGPNGLIITLY